MRRIFCLSLFLLISVTAICFAASGQYSLVNEDKYWISYSANNSIQLFEIDAKGNVLEPPRVILTQQEQSPLTSLSENGAGHINLWVKGADGHANKTEIDEQTLRVIKKTKTGIDLGNGDAYLKVTQKPDQNFIVVNGFRVNGSVNLDAFGVMQNPGENNKQWAITSTQRCFYYCDGAIASDGRLALWVTDRSDQIELSLQPLNESGRIDGPVKAIKAYDNPPEVVATNVLSGNKRFLLVQERGGAQSQLSLLVLLDSTDNPPIVDQIPLVLGNQRSIGIDPYGRFIIYSANNKEGDPCLFFQALGITGHPSDTRRLLLRNVNPLGMDILKQGSVPRRSTLTVNMPSSYASGIKVLDLQIDKNSVGSFHPGSHFQKQVFVGVHSVLAYGGLFGDYYCSARKPVVVPIEGLSITLQCGWL